MPAHQCSRKSLAKRDFVSPLCTCVEDSGTILDASLLGIRVTQKFLLDLLLPRIVVTLLLQERYVVTAAGFKGLAPCGIR